MMNPYSRNADIYSRNCSRAADVCSAYYCGRKQLKKNEQKKNKTDHLLVQMDGETIAPTEKKQQTKKKKI